MQNESLIWKLRETGCLTVEEYASLIANRDEPCRQLLAKLAAERTKDVYGNQIFVRGLVEISNLCKNDCLYCGIRRSNKFCDRYRLTKEQILSCAAEGYELGFRTIVMQGGEDGFFTDEVVCDIVESIKRMHPDCAVTLSLGERSRESYQRLFDAGADRYLLRHETANPDLYRALHPAELSLENRMRCLRDLKDIGYQTGCGFMVGSPGQTPEMLLEDLRFIQDFQPQMVGIGPFIPHCDTRYRHESPGSAALTLRLLAILRLMLPPVLLPATTALGTVLGDGRQMGMRHGCNVVMPNLSPADVRKKYALYDNKISAGEEAAESVALLKESMASIGYQVVTDRGDFINHETGKDDHYV